MKHPGYGTPKNSEAKAKAIAKAAPAGVKAEAEVTPKVATKPTGLFDWFKSKPTKADPMNCACPKTKSCACHA